MIIGIYIAYCVSSRMFIMLSFLFYYAFMYFSVLLLFSGNKGMSDQAEAKKDQEMRKKEVLHTKDLRPT